MDLIDLLTTALRAAVGPEAAILALAAVGLNVTYGYAGLLNFGQAGFMMVGAYGVAISVATLGAPLWVGVIVALLASAALALLLGIPTLRLRADYFAITSLAVTETLRLLVRSRWLEPATGGVNGLQRFGDGFYALNPIPAGVYEIGPWTWNANQLWLLLVAWAIVVAAAVLVRRLMRSPWGRVINAVRENEDAVTSLGRSVFRHKMQCLTLGGMLGGVAGILLALNQQDVNPDTYMPTWTFFAYAALILGGVRRAVGPIVGAMLFWLVLAGADSAISQASIGLSAQQAGAIRFILVGVGLMCLVMFRPQGMFGRRLGVGGDVR